MQTRPDVRDHLQALGPAPDWVVSLGEAIQRLTECPAAIAAARARDLSRAEGAGQGLAWLTRGWLALEATDANALSPMQRETLRLVLEGVLESLQRRFRRRTEDDAEEEDPES